MNIDEISENYYDRLWERVCADDEDEFRARLLGMDVHSYKRYINNLEQEGKIDRYELRKLEQSY